MLFYLWVGEELMLVRVQERPGVGFGVVDVDLEAGVQGGALAVGATRERALENLADPLHRQHGAVRRLALQVLQGRVEPTETQDEK